MTSSMQQRRPHVSLLGALCVLGIGLLASPLVAQNQNQNQDQRRGTDVRSAEPTKPVGSLGGTTDTLAAGAPRVTQGESSMSERRMMRRWRNPRPADIDLFLAVAGDLNPDWCERLTTLRDENPEAFNRAVSSNGRKLWQLVELRERKPDLYALRIEEMRVNTALRSLGQQYHLAVREGRKEDVSELLLKIQETATKQIDIQMRVRGEELAAMAEALERLRSELLAEATERVERAAELAESIIATPMPEAGGDSMRPHGERPQWERSAPQEPAPGSEGTNEKSELPVG